MTALLNALERAGRVGWRAVAGTALAAVVALGLISALRMQPAKVSAVAPAAFDPQEELVPVITAAFDLAKGTIVTFEMLEQRSMPARYVTNSVVKPGSASYIIDYPINVPVQRGDTLLWSQFEPMPREGKLVLTVGRDLAEGTVVSADGVPYDIGRGPSGDHAAQCMVKALAGWSFPARGQPTLDVELPIRLVR